MLVVQLASHRRARAGAHVATLLDAVDQLLALERLDAVKRVRRTRSHAEATRV